MRVTQVITVLATLPCLALCQPKSGDPSFEVASVKAAREPAYPPSMSLSGGRLTARTVSARLLIGYAYDIRDWQIVGGPSWLSSDVFDIDAKKPAGGTDSLNVFRDQQTRAMMRSLLEEQFRLTLRKQQREGVVYALRVAKGGSRPGLKESTSVDDRNLRTGVSNSKNDRGPVLIGTRASLKQLAANLSESLDRPVVDETGLRGAYDFAVQYAPEQSSYDLPSIFTALQEELGLRLESRKGQVEVFLVERVELPTGQ